MSDFGLSGNLFKGDKTATEKVKTPKDKIPVIEIEIPPPAGL